MSPESTLVEVAGGQIAVQIRGDGPLVVMIPSAGRGAADFEHLATAVAAAGYRVACPEPRGIGATTAPVEGLSMTTLALDHAAVIAALGAEPAVVVGHAFGNRVARMTATEHPSLVRGVVLLACGGSIAPSAEAAASLNAVFDASLSADEHLEHVRFAFFADGNDASVWADGWHGPVAQWQGRATRAMRVSHWWAAGSAPMLVVQPADDVVAPPANGQELADRLGERVELHVVDDAGHALLPEQPDRVATLVVDWLERRTA